MFLFRAGKAHIEQQRKNISAARRTKDTKSYKLHT